MLPSESSITARELQRQEWLTYADQQRLADLACAGTRCREPHEALAAAILALVHRLAALMPLAPRTRPATGLAAQGADAPPPVIAPGG